MRVKFVLPPGWKLATLLEPADAPAQYRAANYDDLADSPIEAGAFEEYSYVQSGATYRVIVHARGSDYSPDRLMSSLKKITATETALMRDVPFSRYTFIFHFTPDGGGAMEHRNGAAISVSPERLRTRLEGVESLAAHEFFHLWNVKRIRPQGLEPVDYVHGNDTSDLWFSEGVTSTYGELALLRAGLVARRDFYAHVADEIHDLEERPARKFQSVIRAGREAWLEKYADYSRPERSIFVNEFLTAVPMYNQRHGLRPGITGWGQIHYDYAASREQTREKLEYDLFYVKNASFLLDLAILLRTTRTVVGVRGR